MQQQGLISELKAGKFLMRMQEEEEGADQLVLPVIHTPTMYALLQDPNFKTSAIVVLSQAPFVGCKTRRT